MNDQWLPDPVPCRLCDGQTWNPDRLCNDCYLMLASAQ